MNPSIDPLTGPAIRSFRPTRRSLLLSTAAMIVSVSAVPAFAQALDYDFLALSRAVTGHDDLSAVTASRIHAAMARNDPGFLARASQLAGLAGSHADPTALLAAAEGVGLRDTMLAIVSAWYTGTVGTGAQAAVVSYADALMYWPVRDGLIVPTYCSNGPLWWSRPVPPADITPPGSLAKNG
jgi:fructose 5-dehydrogenase small subunit